MFCQSAWKKDVNINNFPLENPDFMRKKQCIHADPKYFVTKELSI